MSRSSAPYEEHRMLPEDLKEFEAPRRSRADLAFAALAAALAFTAWLEVVPQQARPLAPLQDEEGARVVGLAGEVIATQLAGGPRELSPWRMSHPVQCAGPRGGEWILQGERTGLPAPLPRCVNANLRRGVYAP
jgi:hypothetical protein